MKNILIVHHNMVVGGIEKSLIELLKKLSLQNDYNIDLLLFKRQGALLNELPENINVKEVNGLLRIFGVRQSDAKKFGFVFFIKRTFWAIWCRFFGNRLPIKIGLKQQERYKCDIGIAYTHDGDVKTTNTGPQDFVLECINATKKYTFVHSDFIKANLGCKQNIERDLKFDKIFCVTKSCMNDISKHYPMLENRLDYFYNIIDEEKIKEKANEFNVNYKLDAVNIVSVSRLSKVKGYMRSLQIFNRLHREGLKFYWHIIGGGEDYEKMQKYIKENDLRNCVFMYGEQINPYPYIKSANWLYLGSYHESSAIVIAEAKSLEIPTISTNTISAKEVIQDYGIVCENNFEQIYNTIKKVIINYNLKKFEKPVKNDNVKNENLVKLLI